MKSRHTISAFACLLVGACSQAAPPSAPVAAASAPFAPPPMAAASSATATGSCQVRRTFDNDGWHVVMRAKAGGGPCRVDTTFESPGGKTGRVSRVIGTSGSVTTAPSHGTANLDFDQSGSSATYTPNPGYTGPDHFDMRVLPGSRNWSVDVTVS